MTSPRVAVLAEDLIWSTRIATTVERGGGVATRVRDSGAFEIALSGVDAAIVDTTARGYDGVAAVSAAREVGVQVMALAQHEDLELRRRLFGAGAARVVTYNAFFRSGASIVEELLAEAATLP